MDIEEQLIQYTPDKNRPCVMCGYCCKKATCNIGIAHGAEQTNCKFLVGDGPGNYLCWLAVKEIYPHIKIDLGIGLGCCSPLFNEDRQIAMVNRKIEVKMKRIITLNVIQIDEGSETVETPFLVSSDELNDREKNQLHDDTKLEIDELMPINEVPRHIKESVVERFKEMEIW